MGATHSLIDLFQKDSRLLLGMMSGMSMDGIDLALVRITQALPVPTIELLESAELPLEPELREALLAARVGGTAAAACALNMRVGRAFAETALRFLDTCARSPTEVDAIGSHGQTLVHHAPGGEPVASSLQLGPPSVIAALTGLPTIGNFRVGDMAVGGHGAPLIPLLDHALFRRPGDVVAVNNLGSISNVTIVTDDLDSVTGFDTGPANMAIDHFSRAMTGDSAAIDRDGHLSALGCIHKPLLADLLRIPFFNRRPPRSAGYDDFGPKQLDEISAAHADCRGADLVRTAVEFTVESLARAYEQHVFPAQPGLTDIILTGGGAHHPGIVDGLQSRLAAARVRSLAMDDPQLNSAKEAVGIALLADQFLSGRRANLPSVTGAARAVILGEFAY